MLDQSILIEVRAGNGMVRRFERESTATAPTRARWSVAIAGTATATQPAGPAAARRPGELARPAQGAADR